MCSVNHLKAFIHLSIILPALHLNSDVMVYWSFLSVHKGNVGIILYTGLQYIAGPTHTEAPTHAHNSFSHSHLGTI